MKGYTHPTRTMPLLPVRSDFSLAIGARLFLLLLGLAGLCACGGNSSSPSSGSGASISGNWQFSLTAPTDASFSGGLLGGFLLQQKGVITGQVLYSLSMPGSPPVACDGSAVVTGSLSEQQLTLTATAGAQTFSLAGTINPDGSSVSGTYSTLATNNCGTAQSGLKWSANLVPSVTGSVEGYIHSTSSGVPTDPVANQDFQVTGNLFQGPNTGANSAAVTGTLNFQGYPCLDTVSVNGQISGNSVILQLIAVNGLNIGRIGAPPATPGLPAAVTFGSAAAGGYVLQGPNGYGVSTGACPGNTNSPGDVANVCLALGSSTSCKQSLSLTPAVLTFPSQLLGSAPASQQIKVTNIGTSALSGLQVSPTGNAFTPGDFNGIPSFTEQDDCSSTPGSTFSLAPQQSCAVTILFSPQESCPWQPMSVGFGASAAPSQCPPFQPVRAVQLSAPPALNATVTVSCPSCPSLTSDSNSTFSVTVAALGQSSIEPSTPGVDFGAEDATLAEVSAPQTVVFTNVASSPVQILPSLANPPCGATTNAVVQLPRPATPGAVPGIQVVAGSPSPNPPSLVNGSTISYICDIDGQTQKPNFQIVSDDCSGTLLAPQQSCSVTIVYAPQPLEAAGGLQYFLQLNTLQCTSTTTTECEIDSGRFPVALKSPLANPLRMSPGAGLDFGTWPVGQTTFPPLTITLSNDAKVANPQPINFNAIVRTGDYVEVDNCGISLAPGSSCTMNITFAPKITGFDPGSISISYNTGQINGLQQVISLRGFGQ